MHRDYDREEEKRVEKEWREEKRRKIEEEPKPRMGWSKSDSPGWHAPRAGEEDLHRPEGQMGADMVREVLEGESSVGDGEKGEGGDWDDGGVGGCR